VIHHRKKGDFMRVLLAALAVSTVVALSGCNEGTPGGPGVTTDSGSSTTTSSTDSSDSSTTSDTTSGEDKTDANSSTTTTTTTTDDAAPANTEKNTNGETPATSATTDSKNSKDDGVGDPDNTFRLDMPNLTTELKQGESQIISVGITREDNFDEDVTLEFKDLPKGVTIEPAKPMIKAGDAEAKITIKAADDAALDDHTINVIGKPTKGASATNKLNISIEKP
jgi:hypothetical protein